MATSDTIARVRGFLVFTDFFAITFSSLYSLMTGQHCFFVLCEPITQRKRLVNRTQVGLGKQHVAVRVAHSSGHSVQAAGLRRIAARPWAFRQQAAAGLPV